MVNKTIGTLLVFIVATSCGCGGKNHAINKDEQATKISQAAETKMSSENAETNRRKILFVRNGGGNIEYTLQPQADSISLHIRKFSFKAADFSVKVSKSDIDSSTVKTIEQIINGELDLGKPDTTKRGGMMMTGTWAFAYLLEDDTTRTQIHDKEIVNTISLSEETVRTLIESADSTLFSGLNH